MRVHIDEALFECSHLFCEGGEPVRWNGWVQPVFTTGQMRDVIAFGVLHGWEDCEEGWYQVAPNLWMVDGWAFQEEPQCGFCGGEASGRIYFLDASRGMGQCESLACDECVDDLRDGDGYAVTVESL